MDVRLLNHTPDPERAIAVAARLCYAPVGAAELLETMSDEAVRKVLRTIIKSGHTSALEHAAYTFAVDGVSRAMTHQLVRHRIGASFNQQSQRYVVYEIEGGGKLYIIPPSIFENPEALKDFTELADKAFELYAKYVKTDENPDGLPAEDLRYFLPFGAETKIVITMNIRELLHFFNLRCCNRAQWEIRELAHRMLELAEPTAPYIFLDAGAGCRRGACPEGDMSCGKPYTKAPKR